MKKINFSEIQVHYQAIFPKVNNPEGCLTKHTGSESGWWGYESSSQIIGFVTLGQINASAMIMYNFAILKEFRHQGHGKIFLNQIIDHLTSVGIKELFLFVNKTNKLALKLYRNLGFKSDFSYKPPPHELLLKIIINSN